MTIHCDDKGAVDLGKNPVFRPKTKRIDIKHHFLREKLEEGQIVIDDILTEEMVADSLTKALPFEKCLEIAKMENFDDVLVEDFLEDDLEVLDFVDMGYPRSPIIMERCPKWLTKPTVMTLLTQIENQLEYPDDRNNSLRFYASSGHIIQTADFMNIHVSTSWQDLRSKTKKKKSEQIEHGAVGGPPLPSEFDITDELILSTIAPTSITGTFSQTFTFQDVKSKWQNIASILNSAKRSKVRKQWKKSWQDLRSKTKKKKSEQIEHGAVGGPPLPSKFDITDELILSTIAPTSITGDTNISGTPIDFDSTFNDIMEDHPVAEGGLFSNVDQNLRTDDSDGIMNLYLQFQDWIGILDLIYGGTAYQQSPTDSAVNGC
ncbi:hypothetical protein JTB14_032557 [Gonioctena quinquepunctata]|nr:hypothetical protein JTB14_032557 [Gonioctena quinquepunctata]